MLSGIRGALYYYIGVYSGKHSQGLERIHFLNPRRYKVYPYVKWAESMDLLKFFGIVDIGDIIQDIKDRTR